MMRTSHSMDRRRNEVRKGDIFENMDAQSSSSEKQELLGMCYILCMCVCVGASNTTTASDDPFT